MLCSYGCSAFLFCSCLFPTLCNSLACGAAVHSVEILKRDVVLTKINFMLNKGALETPQLILPWITVTRQEKLSHSKQQRIHGELTLETQQKAQK